jgi:hypothetical protein
MPILVLRQCLRLALYLSRQHVSMTLLIHVPVKIVLERCKVHRPSPRLYMQENDAPLLRIFFSGFESRVRVIRPSSITLGRRIEDLYGVER